MRHPEYERIDIPVCPPPLTPIESSSLRDFKKPESYVYSSIKSDISRQLIEVLGFQPELTVQIIEPPLSVNADLAYPCYSLAKHLRRSPEDIAQELALKIGNPAGLIQKATSEKGFLNFHFNRQNFGSAVLSEVEDAGVFYGAQNGGEGKRVIIDFSSPNIAKFMSVGHLRSTVIGASLSRIYEHNGYEVITDNHLGDWGTQFGMLGRAFELWGEEIAEIRDNTDPVRGLYKLYTRIHDEVEKQKSSGRGESSLEAEGRAWFKRLESGDPKATELLNWATEQSLKEFQRIYDLLGVKFNYALGESFYVGMLPGLIARLLNRNVATKDNSGAVVVDLEDVKLGKLVIQKMDGASLYSTRDLATLIARDKWFKPEKILYVVGGDQREYFQQVFETYRRFTGRIVPETKHVSFGMITLPDGKMSTRKGRVVFLEEVLNEAITRARERIDRTSSDITEDEKDQIAREIGVGAVIYYDLGQGRDRNIKFDWDKAFKIEGQSAPYIQYAYARTNAIIEKAQYSGKKVNPSAEALLTTHAEFILAKRIAQYPDSIRKAMLENQPSVVAGSVYAIADAFNNFYTSDKVIGTDDPILSTRLRLTAATGQVIRNGLNILGIEAPRRM